MNSKVLQDFQQSDSDFREVVWPKISRAWDWFSGATLVNGHEILDQFANVDYIAKSPRGIISIASRVQRVRSEYRTFTIRRTRNTGTKTELEKTQTAISSRTMIASYMTHGYLSMTDRELLAVYGARVDDLYKVLTGLESIKENPEDGNTFICISVDYLKSRGVEVREIQFSAQEFLERCHVKHEGPRDVRLGDRWLPWHLEKFGPPTR